MELVIQEHIQIKFYFVNLTFKYKVYMYFKKFNRDLNLIDYFSFELSLLIFTLEKLPFHEDKSDGTSSIKSNPVH